MCSVNISSQLNDVGYAVIKGEASYIEMMNKYRKPNHVIKVLEAKSCRFR